MATDMGQPGAVSREYATPDDAIRAIQGLKLAGVSEDRVRIIASDGDVARYIAEQTGSEVDGTAEGFEGYPSGGGILVTVDAGEDAELVRRVMVDGVVDGAGLVLGREEGVYMDPSTGSTAGVGTSTGTATGIAMGAGYEGNTGSTAMTTTGPLGQFAPRADSPDPEDDFPGHRK